MPQPRIPLDDPRLAPIQVTFRLPWHYKVQLDKIAASLDTTTPQLIIGCIEEMFPPDPLEPMEVLK